MKFDYNRRLATVSTGRRPAVSGFSLLLCGSLLLGSAQMAGAAHNHESLREFRASHADLDRREARQLFRATFNGRSTGGASLPRPIIPPAAPPDVNRQTNWRDVIFNGHPMTRREAKLLRVGAQDNGANLVRLSTGVDLDLSSADRNIVLGENLFKTNTSVEITVGSEKQTFSAGSKATAAEYVAIKQALSTNSGQKLVIDQSGIASGGSVDLSELTGNNNPLRASSLTVSSGVTAYGDFGRRSDFTLEGDLNNYGTVVALSGNRHVRSAAIRAEDITNNAGATITSVIPDALANSHLSRKVDLTLEARGDLSNFGTLSSNGDLSLIAGNSISNKGTVSANDSVNMAAPTINNSSTITALAGNINIDGPATRALNVNNIGGTLSALNGAINVRTPDYAGTFDNNINGGDLFSKQVNINGGNATNYIDVNQLTGTLSQTGSAGHVKTSTENLELGSNCLTGDPTFFNNGNISITGLLTASQALTIIASGSILSSNDVTIEARNAASGFDITMIAGANIVTPAGGDPTLPTGTPTAVTIDGNTSATGGNILLNPGTKIITSPIFTKDVSAAGGNLNLYAFYKGTGTKSGIVDVNAASITTGGIGTGTNGNVNVIAGGTDDTGTFGFGVAVQIGALNSTGGTGSGGNLNIVTAQPVASAGNITYNSDGSLAPGSFLQASGTITPTATIGQALGQAKIAGNADFNAGKDIIQDSSTTNSSLFTDNFNSIVTLKAGGNIGSGVLIPFVIEGFNSRITKKVLAAHGGTSGNNLLTVNAGGTARILRNATTDLSLQTSSAVNGISVRTNSILKVAGDVTSTALDIRLENTGGALIINPNVDITALSIIEITNGSKKKPTLTVGANSTFTTTAAGGPGSGEIFFTVDRKAFSLNAAGFASAGSQSFGPPTIKTSALKPLSALDEGNVVVVGTSPNLAQYAGREPSFSAPPNTFTSNNATIILENAGSKGALNFAGGVLVTAGN